MARKLSYNHDLENFEILNCLTNVLFDVATFILPIENQKIMFKDRNRVSGIGRLEIATSDTCNMAGPLGHRNQA